MTTKYNFEISKNDFDTDINRLTNQLWKLIPMREKEENWFNQLETVILELVGLNEILNINSNFLILLSKLEGIRLTELDFLIYRKTVFECISLLKEIQKNV